MFLRNMTMLAPRGIVSHSALSTLRITFSGITTEMMKILFNPSNFPCLRDVDLAHLHRIGVEHLPAEFGTTEHPGIRRISVVGSNLFSHDILPVALLPNLESVALASYSGQAPILQAFFERSGTHIRTLAFTRDSRAMANVPNHLPALRHLQAPNLDIFIGLKLTEATFPRLQSVVCTGKHLHLSDVAVEALLAYVQHRWKTMDNPIPLTVKIPDGTEVDGILLQRLRACSQLRMGRMPSQKFWPEKGHGWIEDVVFEEDTDLV
jgi:hypothetical protein